MTKKISIVMAYYNRKEQLRTTFGSLLKSAYSNWELIIVDDVSDDDQRAKDIFSQKEKRKYNIKIINIDSAQRTWTNPCICYNMGIKKASGDIIVLQNPECMHVGDVLSFVVDNLDKKDWMSFNCYGSPYYKMNKEISKLSAPEIYQRIERIPFRIGGNSVMRDDVGGWLNHYEKHFVAYHYCGAIHRKELMSDMGGGFNEKFKNALGTDDDEFIKRLIYNKFNFTIAPHTPTTPFVFHQYHEKPDHIKQCDPQTTRHIFDEACIKMGMVPENNIHVAPIKETPMGHRILIV